MEHILYWERLRDKHPSPTDHILVVEKPTRIEIEYLLHLAKALCAYSHFSAPNKILLFFPPDRWRNLGREPRSSAQGLTVGLAFFKTPLLAHPTILPPPSFQREQVLALEPTRQRGGMCYF